MSRGALVVFVVVFAVVIGYATVELVAAFAGAAEPDCYLEAEPHADASGSSVSATWNTAACGQPDP